VRSVPTPEDPGYPRRRPRPGPTGRGVVLVALVSIAAAGCLGQSGGGTVPRGAEVVQIHQMAFRPRVVTVRVGQPVTWRFEDAQVEHDVDAADGSFHSPLKDSGTWTHTFTAPGTYSYFCSVHTASS
jgi:plastocyanin